MTSPVRTPFVADQAPRYQRALDAHRARLNSSDQVFGAVRQTLEAIAATQQQARSRSQSTSAVPINRYAERLDEKGKLLGIDAPVNNPFQR